MQSNAKKGAFDPASASDKKPITDRARQLLRSNDKSIIKNLNLTDLLKPSGAILNGTHDSKKFDPISINDNEDIDLGAMN